MPTSTASVTALLTRLGVAPDAVSHGDWPSCSPIDGATLGTVHTTPVPAVAGIVAQAHAAQQAWRNVPAPQRGELVRLLGEALRTHKQDLGTLVSLEAGKVLSEGLGEVQEMIDICDFAVGLSRQLYGLTIASERPGHRMMETWHPLGVVGVITAFNFPVAVWGWNAALALVCGNSVVWKPSEKTPLCALAVQAIFDQACQRFDAARTAHLSQLVMGRADVGEALVDHPQVALVSATGSTRMGQAVGPRVAARFGRSLLELGGNNAIIVAPSADLDMAVRAVAFAAAGTAGQRCTTARRLIVHTSVHADLVARLTRAFASFTIASPLEAGTLVGPLIDQAAFDAMQAALRQAQEQGGRVLVGGERALQDRYPDAYYARPAMVDMPAQTAVVCHETFAPILYVMQYTEWPDAIALNNAVPQGLSSSIFTTDVREAEQFMSAAGSDCGIANVNIGTSGAEIGGAFGGEKQTGGGRESGSDAWKSYMRRATNTVNYSRELPLAQGVRFELG